MKALIIFITVLLVSNTIYSQIGWFELNTGMTLNQHGGIAVIDENLVYVISDGGLLYKTIDGGLNWIENDINIDEQFFGIDFLDNNTGFITGSNGALLKTNDGGENWIKISTETTENIHAITIVDSHNVWCVGDNGVILHSRDGGNIWELNNSITNSNLYDIKFKDNNIGVIIGHDSLFLKTLDAGISWNPPYPSVDFFGDLFSLCITDNNIRFIVGGVYGVNNGEHFGIGIYKSEDEGETWYEEYVYPISSSSHLTSIGFVTDDIGFLIDFDNNSDNGTIVKMENGTNYNYISHNFNSSEINRYYSKVEYYDENIAYLLTGNYILKTVDGGTYIGLNEFVSNKLLNIKPNPVHDVLYLSAQNDISINSIQIYDVLGKLVTQEYNNPQQIDVSLLKSGVYLAKIETNRGVLNRKVIKE